MAASVLALAATGAHGQTVQPTPHRPGLAAASQAATHTPASIIMSRAAFAIPYADAGASRPAGVAQTALDHRFGGVSRDGDLIGSAGFLCGLQPTTANGGAAEARGTDTDGRFLGAKLSFAFK